MENKDVFFNFKYNLKYFYSTKNTKSGITIQLNWLIKFKSNDVVA